MSAPGVISFRDIPIQVPAEEEVLLKILRIGICGSDIHVYHGTHPFMDYPVTQGHEVCGTVEAVGAGVSGFRKGDKVTLQPQVVCGKCYSCTHGNYHICDELKVMGFQTTGTASEFFCCNQKHLLRLPDGMDPDEGAMIEPVAVAVHALGRCKDLEGEKVFILGAGPIGNLVAQCARGMGAKEVLISDLSDYRLTVARDVGIDYVVNPRRQDTGEVLRECFGPDRADLILDCVGVPATITCAVEVARKGTDIIIVGVFGEKPQVDLGLIQDRELRLIGTAMYREPDFIKAIDLVKTGKVQLGPLMSDHFPFNEYPDAYRFIEKQQDQVMKVFIDVDRE